MSAGESSNPDTIHKGLSADGAFWYIAWFNASGVISRISLALDNSRDSGHAGFQLLHHDCTGCVALADTRVSRMSVCHYRNGLNTIESQTWRASRVKCMSMDSALDILTCPGFLKEMTKSDSEDQCNEQKYRYYRRDRWLAVLMTGTCRHDLGRGRT